jgi:uncharacterized protein (TIGR03435 family)
MRNRFGSALIAGVLLAPGVAFAQPAPTAQPAPAGPTFDAASVRQSPAPDMAKMIADLQVGKKPESVHIEGSRATFTYESLNQLIAYAYKARAYEISGPDWLVTDRFDIVARMPDGASKDDVPAMLRALLEDRFKLTAHRAMQEQPVLGLVVAKGGPKLKPSTETPEPVDETAPLKPGESMMDTPGGPIRLIKNQDGSTTYNMGTRGTFTLKFDGESLSMHMQASALSMNGFAMMMTTLGGGDGRQIVDMTALTGLYQTAVDFSLMDLMSSLRDQGINLPTGPPGGPPAGGASDPGGGATVSAALEKLGLRLEGTRATVARIVVDHVEKIPTEN